MLRKDLVSADGNGGETSSEGSENGSRYMNLREVLAENDDAMMGGSVRHKITPADLEEIKNNDIHVDTQLRTGCLPNSTAPSCMSRSNHVPGRVRQREYGMPLAGRRGASHSQPSNFTSADRCFLSRK